MFCPSCGTQNDAANRFCLKCGTTLAQTRPTQVSVPAASPVPIPQAMPPMQVVEPKPRNPAAAAAIIGGITGIGGGAASAIGWFMPWFGVGAGLSNMMGGLLGLGVLGGGIGSLLGGGIGGSGFQLLLFALQIPSMARSFSGPSSDTSTVTVLALSAAAVLALILLMAVLNLRTGALAFQLRSSLDKYAYATINDWLQTLVNRSAFGFILMVVVFILVSQIPFATLLLSGGFFLTAGGFAATWFVGLYAKSQIRSK